MSRFIHGIDTWDIGLTICQVNKKFTSNLPYVISYSIIAKRLEVPDKVRVSSASLFIVRLLSSGSVVNSPKLGVIQIHTAGETSLPNGASVTVK